MSDLPVMLKVEGRRAVVVGGGPTAARRVATLVECGARVVVIAPQINPTICQPQVEIVRREYRPDDLTGAFLVVVATDDPAVNDVIGRQAAAAGVLVNRADEPQEGDFTVMAQGRRGAVTVAVSTGRASAQAAAAIRDDLLAKLDESWVRLLSVTAEYRQRLRSADDARKRQSAMRRLTDASAMAALRSGGEAALRDHCQRILEEVGQS